MNVILLLLILVVALPVCIATIVSQAMYIKDLEKSVKELRGVLERRFENDR